MVDACRRLVCGLTVFALGSAYLRGGLRRGQSAPIVCAYLAFAGLILTSAYSSPKGMMLGTTLPIAVGIVLVVVMMCRTGKRGNGHSGGASETTHNQSRLSQGLARLGMIGRSCPDRLDTAGSTNGRARPASSLVPDRSLVAGWSVSRIYYAALLIGLIVGAIDAILGHGVILIGLLPAVPCCALLTGRWSRTAAAGAWAITLAVLLGLPDEIWGTYTHLAFLGGVMIATVVSTAAAAVIGRSRRHTQR